MLCCGVGERSSVSRAWERRRREGAERREGEGGRELPTCRRVSQKIQLKIRDAAVRSHGKPSEKKNKLLCCWVRCFANECVEF